MSYKDTITVGELINQLSQFDPNIPVLFSHYNSEWGEDRLYPYDGSDVRKVTHTLVPLASGGSFESWDLGGDIDAVVF